MGGRPVVMLVLALVLVLAVHATTDEQRLAALSAKMLNLTTDGHDYAMDCGPAAEVLNVLPSQSDISADYFCVLNTSGHIIYGTFGDDLTVALSTFIAVYNDTAYRSQIQITDVNAKACNVALNPLTFTECPGALQYTINGRTTALHTYVYEDGAGTDAIYVLVSEQPITDNSFLTVVGNNIIDFFKTFLGWI